MKQIASLIILTSILVMVFAGCQLDQPQKDINEESIPAVCEPAIKRVFLGGSLIVDPSNESINHVYPGMSIDVRMVEYEDNMGSEDLEEVPQSEKYGTLTFTEVYQDRLVFDVIITNTSGMIAVNKNSVELTTGNQLDLDENGTPDISLVVPEREGLGSAKYLTFISSYEDMYSTMYQLLPDDLPKGMYPSGIAGVNCNGDLVTVQQEPESSRNITRNSSDPLSNIIREGDIVVNPWEHDALITEVTGVKGRGGMTSYSLRNDDPEVMAKAAFELMYMDVDGRATEFNDLPNSRGTYNIFNRTITVNRVLFEDKDAGSSASLGIEVMVDFDIYLAASFSAKWTGISAGLSAYAIINSSIIGSVSVTNAVTYGNEKAIKLFTIPLTVMAGPVPIKIKVPLYLGYDLEAYGSATLSTGLSYEGRFGFTGLKIKCGFTGVKFTAPRLVNSHKVSIIPPEVSVAVGATAFGYVFADLDVAPAGIIHAGIPSKFGLEVEISNEVTNSGVGDWLLEGRLKATGETEVGIGWGPIKYKKKLPISWDVTRDIFEYNITTGEFSY